MYNPHTKYTHSSKFVWWMCSWYNLFFYTSYTLVFLKIHLCKLKLILQQSILSKISFRGLFVRHVTPHILKSNCWEKKTVNNNKSQRFETKIISYIVTFILIKYDRVNIKNGIYCRFGTNIFESVKQFWIFEHSSSQFLKFTKNIQSEKPFWLYIWYIWPFDLYKNVLTLYFFNVPT